MEQNNIDKRYKDAVEAGDKELAYELAMEVATSKGFNVPAYHGTYGDFNEFKKGDIGFHFSEDIGIAINRLDDIEFTDEQDIEGKTSSIHHVALSVHKPYKFPYDLGDWNAGNIFKVANAKFSEYGQFASTNEYTLGEQKRFANATFKLLSKLGYHQDDVVRINSEIEDSEGKLNSNYTLEIRNRFIEKGIDALVYINDYEPFESDDPTCYIVFSPNQIKSIDPIYEQGVLISLSKRFDKDSPRFR